jgi:glutamate dehydrogenase (NADP+)
MLCDRTIIIASAIYIICRVVIIRPEATGYGCVSMAEVALVDKKFGAGYLKDKRCGVSGSRNVAQHTAVKLIELGAKVMTLRDSNGVLVFQDGVTTAELALVIPHIGNQKFNLSSI